MAASFDRVAPYYDRLSRWVFGDMLLAAQRCFLSQIPGGAHVLFLGGGTGLLLDDLLQLSQTKSITYIEASARMLAMAKKRVTQLRKSSDSILPPVHFVHGTEHDIPPGQYSIVITCFLLDMYKPVALHKMMLTIRSTLSPDAQWLFTDFEISKQPDKHWWHWLLVKSMFLFFLVTAGLTVRQLPDYKAAFNSIGFRRQTEKSFYGKLIVSRVYKQAN